MSFTWLTWSSAALDSPQQSFEHVSQATSSYRINRGLGKSCFYFSLLDQYRAKKRRFIAIVSFAWMLESSLLNTWNQIHDIRNYAKSICFKQRLEHSKKTLSFVVRSQIWNGTYRLSFALGSKCSFTCFLYEAFVMNMSPHTSHSNGARYRWLASWPKWPALVSNREKQNWHT